MQRLPHHGATTLSLIVNHGVDAFRAEFLGFGCELGAGDDGDLWIVLLHDRKGCGGRVRVGKREGDEASAFDLGYPYTFMSNIQPRW